MLETDDYFNVGGAEQRKFCDKQWKFAALTTSTRSRARQPFRGTGTTIRGISSTNAPNIAGETMWDFRVPRVIHR